MSLLVLSGLKDVEIDIIIPRVQEIGITVERINTYTIADYDYNIKISNDDSFIDLGFDISKVEAVFCKLPINIRGYVSKEMDVFETFVAEEQFWFMQNIQQLIPSNAIWINDPFSEEKANCKIKQLLIAKKNGLKIPDTIISNSPDEILKFYKKHNGNIIYKPIFHSGQIQVGRDEAVYTTQITEKHLKNINYIKTAPGVFQEKINNVADIRVIVVNNKCFGYAIKGSDNVDWRLNMLDNIDIERVKIDDDIKYQIITTMNEFGIKLAAFDFILDKKGNLTFIELNPGGRWLQFDKQLSYEVADEIAVFISKICNY